MWFFLADETPRHGHTLRRRSCKHGKEDHQHPRGRSLVYDIAFVRFARFRYASESDARCGPTTIPATAADPRRFVGSSSYPLVRAVSGCVSVSPSSKVLLHRVKSTILEQMFMSCCALGKTKSQSSRV
jgi:hypothetical protein